MRKLFKKLREKKAETFAELLIAVLIVAFGCMLIATLYSSAFYATVKTKEEDESLNDAISKMEQFAERKESVSGGVSVTITDGEQSEEVKVDVNVFGDDSVTSYYRP